MALSAKIKMRPILAGFASNYVVLYITNYHYVLLLLPLLLLLLVPLHKNVTLLPISLNKLWRFSSYVRLIFSPRKKSLLTRKALIGFKVQPCKILQFMIGTNMYDKLKGY